MHFKKLIFVVAGLAAINSVNGTVRTTPTNQDLAGHEWINKVRADPKIILPELNYMLCKEFNPVPSPGGAFNTVNNICKSVTGPLWKLIGPILGKG